MTTPATGGRRAGGWSIAVVTARIRGTQGAGPAARAPWPAQLLIGWFEMNATTVAPDRSSPPARTAQPAGAVNRTPWSSHRVPADASGGGELQAASISTANATRSQRTVARSAPLDHLRAFRADRHVADRHSGQRLQLLNIGPGGEGQLVPGAAAGGIG